MSGQFFFSQVPMADIPRSSFNRSHGLKTTFNAGLLVPIFVDEALPGDTFHLSLSAFARLATPVVPIMDNLHMEFFFFAVPNRLVWEHWQAFMGETDKPYSYVGQDQPIEYTVPMLTAPTGGFQPLSIYDYMGIPTYVAGIEVSALPFRAYNLIWNEWFRDQNMQDPVPQHYTDAPEPVTDYAVLRRGKRHDYFTSCLPWPQKGPGVEIPIGGYAPVVKNGLGMPTFLNDSAASDQTPQPLVQSAGPGEPRAITMAAVSAGDAAGYLSWSDPGLIADLSQATAVTINDLRMAFQLQKLQERDARGGTRYTEILRSHFGVVSPDSRLQRPEYLGGGSVPVVINPVSQTSGSPKDGDATGPTGGATPQGNLAGYGVAGASNIGFSKSFVEHSIVIGLVMVRADLSYQQGLHKMWSRKTKHEFYWPALAHVGEQDVKVREIYATGTAQDLEVFGYQERWAEYRYFPSIITGAFRSNYKSAPELPAPDSLDYWHLAQEFGTRPTLSAEFIADTSDAPVRRAVSVQSEPQFIFDSHFAIKCVRPMPTYSVPGLIDHF